MKKIVKKLLCLIVVASMICCIPIQVNAEDDKVNTISENDNQVNNGENSDDNSDQSNLNFRQDNVTQGTSGTGNAGTNSTDKSNTGTDSLSTGEEGTENTDQTDSIDEQKLNYIYVESPYLETPGTQNVVVSWGDGTENLDEMSLMYCKNGGALQQWNSSLQKDGLFLFRNEYLSEEDTGAYDIFGIKIKKGDAEKEYSLEEFQAVAQFGVNEDYQGYGASVASEISEEVDASIVAIDENGNVVGKSSIESALEEAGVGAASAKRSKSRAKEGERSNIVVALDAGHDAKSAGASANGLREEELTLKIAKYCKEELEKYSGVTVYMTRETAACPVNINPHSAGTCIWRRVENAAKAGAKVFVSLHLNSATSSTAKGAEIIIPNGGGKYEHYTQGKALAEEILSELVALGLDRRPNGIYYKNSTNGEKYDDGSTADYFAVQNAGKEYNVPGIIVEHAFISNSGNKDHELLVSEEGLKKLGIADATGIAEYLGLSKGNWETDADGNKYYYENGKKVYGEKAIGGKWYHFDEKTGVMTTGWYDFPGKRVYYAETGEMVHGEQAIAGKWYNFNPTNGAMITGWYKFPGKTVYYAATGEMVYGEQKIDGVTYHFDPFSGAVLSGWGEIDGNKVYSLGKDGLARGECAINGKWYCFDEKTGYMITGWHDFKTKTVYYAPTGEMVYGEQAINGKWYNFNPVTGALIKGWYKFPGKKVFYDNDSGEMLYGLQEIKGQLYYFDKITGGVYIGWGEDNGRKLYSLGENGLATGERAISGKWYCFEKDTGYMITGWHDLKTKKVYYAVTGEMVYGEQAINGKWYNFNSVTGAMITGWHQFPGKTVYYAKTGEMLYGNQEIDGDMFYFNPVTGAVSAGWGEINGNKVYSLGKKGLAKGEYAINGKWYCFDKETGYMITGWYDLKNKRVYYASTGEMVYGEQAIDGKWYNFNPVTGAMTTGWYKLPGKTVYYAKDGKMTYGKAEIDGKQYYFNEITGGMLTDTWMDGEYYGKDGVLTDYDSIYHKIAGDSSTNVDQMVRFYKLNSPISYPAEKLASGGADSIEKFAQIFYEEAEKEGIKAEVAWAQTMHETGYLKFGGQVSIEQFNFAGLGATDNGAKGADFSVYGTEGVRMGVRAQIQHLKAYAVPGVTESMLAEKCIDPRFHLVSPKGCALYVEHLGQKENPSGKGWATSERYGYKILELMVKVSKS